MVKLLFCSSRASSGITGAAKVEKGKEKAIQVVKIIESNIKGINSRIKNTINKMGTNTIYKVNYGNNFFPKKEYNGVSYESGFYESLVITLGEGKGNNWWCVLFPPLCLIDEDDNLNQTEYKLYISEIIEKYN